MNRNEIRMKLFVDTYLKVLVDPGNRIDHDYALAHARRTVESFDLAFPEQEAKPEQDPNRKLRELLEWYDRADRTVVGGWEVIQHAKELLLEP